MFTQTTDSSHEPDLITLPDGTVKQRSPLTGTEVWTLPGRGNRPLHSRVPAATLLSPAEADSYCAFCPANYQRTPPELARLVRTELGWQRIEVDRAEQLELTHAEFRLVPNLFPILAGSYWQANHGRHTPREAVDRANAYTSTPAGAEHLRALLRPPSGAESTHPAAPLPAQAIRDSAAEFYGSTHRLVVARHHFRPTAQFDDQLCGSADLGPADHGAFVTFTVDSLRELLAQTPEAVYAVAFQNWLKPAGASFDHLHKQLVAIDEVGPAARAELDLLARDPLLYQERILTPAVVRDLIIASNEHAVALAGVGHRYPTIEIYSTGAANLPWEHSPTQLRGVADILHACHAATGTAVASNEEWHYRPPRETSAMPWRINLKWRISNPAGFEGVTKIYINTISPGAIAERTRAQLTRLRKCGVVSALNIGPACPAEQLQLHYAS
ncbi:MAG: DUF4921 family protein [Candidatus Nanopelagicales bacterium]